uniref:Dynactin subunit 4 n=1 Tax=Hucho hucho TaxID=62062 RepID=A0A4W5LCD2_9TELE
PCCVTSLGCVVDHVVLTPWCGLCFTVTTLRQRLLQPDFQPAGASQLHPKHKHLLIKRSLRCRKCEHNLSKPEFNPTSIKFKIQLVAVSYIPEVRIMSIPNLRFQKASQLFKYRNRPQNMFEDILCHILSVG